MPEEQRRGGARGMCACDANPINSFSTLSHVFRTTGGDAHEAKSLCLEVCLGQTLISVRMLCQNQACQDVFSLLLQSIFIIFDVPEVVQALLHACPGKVDDCLPDRKQLLQRLRLGGGSGLPPSERI